MHVLLVKLSSLGDIVHTFPAVEDASRRGVTFDWVVEEDFAALPSMHQAVRDVIHVSLRRWRNPGERRIREIRAFGHKLRSKRYELVIDAQGLLKSALIGRWSRGRVRAGFDRASAREPAAALFYSRRAAVERENCHAVERTRRLFAAAIGYDAPPEKPNFGIRAFSRGARGGTPRMQGALSRGARGGTPRMQGALSRGARGDTPGAKEQTEPYCVLLHGTTWESKHWPDAFWTHLAERAKQAGMTPVLPWLTEVERHRAESVTRQVEGALAVGSLPLDAVADLLSGARAVIGVDTGLSHLSAALGRPTVGLFGPTDARLTGCVGNRAHNIQGDIECAPCLSRQCRYTGEPLTWRGEPVEPACFARLNPDRVWMEVAELLT